MDVSGGDLTYGVNKILVAALVVPAEATPATFDLSRIYPNPFRGSVTISFDVPSVARMDRQEVAVSVYDLHGSLIDRLAKGTYLPGHYTFPGTGKTAVPPHPDRASTLSECRRRILRSG
jgi:hypothetical protein